MPVNIDVFVDAEVPTGTKLLLGSEEDVTHGIAKDSWKVLELMVPDSVLVVQGMSRADLPSTVQEFADSLSQMPSSAKVTTSGS